jgi:hypothetical protein
MSDSDFADSAEQAGTARRGPMMCFEISRVASKSAREEA